MAEDNVSEEKASIAREFASPVILRILRNFSAGDIAHAVKNDLNIVESLKENPQVLRRLRLILVAIPFADQVAPYIRSEPWLRWFISNELKHERPDLHTQFIYDPKAFGWLHRNMVRLSSFLFE